MCWGQSRRRVCLTGADPGDPVSIETNMLTHPDDLDAAVAGVQLCRQIGTAAPLRCHSKGEVTPGDLSGDELVDFIQTPPFPTTTAAERRKWEPMTCRWSTPH